MKSKKASLSIRNPADQHVRIKKASLSEPVYGGPACPYKQGKSKRTGIRQTSMSV